VAVVTGGSRGVGHGIAIALGAHGYTVYVTGRTTRMSSRSADAPSSAPKWRDSTGSAIDRDGTRHRFAS
jgi:NAD(P)-dependent dehydrogenase (short-subunit alcohol dehydrogenase family)